MNCELMNRFNNEFLWWWKDISARQCYVKTRRQNWFKTSKPFEINDPSSVLGMVINDDVSRFRIAEADGIPVETLSHIDGRYHPRHPDYVLSREFKHGPDCYRICRSLTWQANISKTTPVLCEVWDDNEKPKFPRIYLIVEYYPEALMQYGLRYNYKTAEEFNYVHAEPILSSVLHDFQLIGSP